jgi:hypothetical protein
MFSGLFLAPWMVMYALSTLVMTHRDFVGSFYPSPKPSRLTERELDYSRAFPPTTSREQIGRQILQDLGLDGAHTLSGGRNGQPLTILRQHALTPRRITFDSNTRKIVVEREKFRSSAFLERMHRRRGYDKPYALDDSWGFTVDVAVVAMMFWSLSGVWLWWELKATRLLGALSFLAGLALYGTFLLFL